MQIQKRLNVLGTSTIPKKGRIKSNDLEWELHFNICIEFNSNVGNSGARPITNFIIFHDKYYNIRHSG